MAIYRVNAAADGTLFAAEGGGDWREGLARALDGVPDAAPVCVLIHGFRYTWRTGIAPDACPHDRLYGAEPVPASTRRRPDRAAWPVTLGFAGPDPCAGLCIGFGWDARIGRHGRRGFGEIYRRAGPAGRGLARLLGALAAARPDLAVDMLTHSLGARVGLEAGLAEPGLPLRRLVFLAAADWAGEARRFLARTAGQGERPQVCHVMSRANDLYDGLFELFAPPPEHPGDRPLGAAGLGREHPRWLDVQLDAPGTAAWLAARGFGLERTRERVSHWHFYADRGAMAFYRAILREPEGYGVGELRAAGLGGPIAPRWSRLLPMLPAAAPAPDGGPEAVPFGRAFTRI